MNMTTRQTVEIVALAVLCLVSLDDGDSALALARPASVAEATLILDGLRHE
jgi:hypothetical protein